MSFASRAGASVRVERGAAAVERLAGGVDCVVIVAARGGSHAHGVPPPRSREPVSPLARERGAEVASTDGRLADGDRFVPP